jgi:hypothetical protein
MQGRAGQSGIKDRFTTVERGRSCRSLNWRRRVASGVALCGQSTAKQHADALRLNRAQACNVPPTQVRTIDVQIRKLLL